jgi:hypothetical protein
MILTSDEDDEVLRVVNAEAEDVSHVVEMSRLDFYHDVDRTPLFEHK